MSRDFWSRRRAAVAAEDARAEAEQQAEDEAQARALREAEQAEKTDAELLAELNLPDPDDLKPGDDVAGFMAKAVPDRLRRRALRALWRSNPALANLDALVEYGEDYTDSATVVANLQTAYQVGKGMLRHVEEMARQEEAKAEAAARAEEGLAEEGPAEDATAGDAIAEGAEDAIGEAQALTDGAPADAETAPDAAPDAAPADTGGIESAEATAETPANAARHRPAPEPDLPPAPTRRRMRFTFDGEAPAAPDNTNEAVS